MIQAIRWCAMLAYVAKFSFKEYQILPNFFSSQKKKKNFLPKFFLHVTYHDQMCVMHSALARKTTII